MELSMKKKIMAVVLIVFLLITLILSKSYMDKKAEVPADVPAEVPATTETMRNNRQIMNRGVYEEYSEPEDTESLTWDEAIKITNLEQSTINGHKNFVNDTSRFSSGANFTSLSDDNMSMASTNFVGMRRPQFVPIGPGARSIPSDDQDILRRNKNFRW